MLEPSVPGQYRFLDSLLNHSGLSLIIPSGFVSFVSQQSVFGDPEAIPMSRSEYNDSQPKYRTSDRLTTRKLVSKSTGSDIQRFEESMLHDANTPGVINALYYVWQVGPHNICQGFKTSFALWR